MFTPYSGRTADDVWRAALADFKKGESEGQAGRGGYTQEILHAALTIEDPRQRWIGSRAPAMNVAFALAEVVWILAGRRDLHFLDHWNKTYKDFAGDAPELHGAYGYRLRTAQGVDQIERAVQVLTHNPESRQVVLQIWDASSDLPGVTGEPVARDIPCNVVALLKVRGGSLHWNQVIRSNDLFLGVPHNVVQFTTLQEVVAGMIGVSVGPYHQVSDSLHVYERNGGDLAASPTSPVQESTDDLALPYRTAKRSIIEMERRAVALIEVAVEDEARHVTEWEDGPRSYRNILSVLAAESHRRRGWYDLSAKVIAECTNPAYVDLWSRWLDRVGASD